MSQSKMKMVYVIAGRGERKVWNRVGVAFVNRDGSLNCRLDSLPVSGELHIRDYVPREDCFGDGQREERLSDEQRDLHAVS